MADSMAKTGKGKVQNEPRTAPKMQESTWRITETCQNPILFPLWKYKTFQDTTVIFPCCLSLNLDLKAVVNAHTKLNWKCHPQKCWQLKSWCYVFRCLYLCMYVYVYFWNSRLGLLNILFPKRGWSQGFEMDDFYSLIPPSTLPVFYPAF